MIFSKSPCTNRRNNGTDLTRYCILSPCILSNCILWNCILWNCILSNCILSNWRRYQQFIFMVFQNNIGFPLRISINFLDFLYRCFFFPGYARIFLIVIIVYLPLPFWWYIDKKESYFISNKNTTHDIGGWATMVYTYTTTLHCGTPLPTLIELESAFFTAALFVTKFKIRRIAAGIFGS